MLQAALSDDSICLAASRIRLSFLSLPSFSSPSSHNTAPIGIRKWWVPRTLVVMMKGGVFVIVPPRSRRLFDPGAYCVYFLLCRKLEILVIRDKKFHVFTNFKAIFACSFVIGKWKIKGELIVQMIIGNFKGFLYIFLTLELQWEICKITWNK